MGGAEVYSDRSPDLPDVQTGVFVPIDPALPAMRENHPELFVARVRELEASNNGEWLIPIAEFANSMTDGIKTVLLDTLDASLKQLE